MLGYFKERKTNKRNKQGHSSIFGSSDIKFGRKEYASSKYNWENINYDKENKHIQRIDSNKIKSKQVYQCKNLSLLKTQGLT